MKDNFFRVAAVLHRLVIRFERFFSQHPEQIWWGRDPQQEVIYLFQKALDLRFTFPQEARVILVGLVGRLTDERFDPAWAAQRLGRIYFQLGNIETDRRVRVAHYRRGLEYMPEHYRCRELLTELLREEAACKR